MRIIPEPPGQVSSITAKISTSNPERVIEAWMHIARFAKVGGSRITYPAENSPTFQSKPPRKRSRPERTN